MERGIANFAANLDAPGDVLNSLLQGRPAPAAQNTLRFAVNTIFGIGGLFDTATALGLPADPTDFGETLHVWGVGEGNYTEVPFLGPKTERDLVGTVVDIAANPVSLLLPSPESACDMTCAPSRGACRSRTTARAAITAAPMATPCTARAAISMAMLGAAMQAREAST